MGGDCKNELKYFKNVYMTESKIHSKIADGIGFTLTYNDFTKQMYACCGYTNDYKTVDSKIYTLDGDLNFKQLVNIDNTHWGNCVSACPLNNKWLIIGGYNPIDKSKNQTVVIFDPFEKIMEIRKLSTPISQGCVSDYVPLLDSVIIVSHEGIFLLKCEELQSRHSNEIKIVQVSNYKRRWMNMIALNPNRWLILGGSKKESSFKLECQPYIIELSYGNIKLEKISDIKFCRHGVNREQIAVNNYYFIGFGLSSKNKFVNDLYVAKIVNNERIPKTIDLECLATNYTARDGVLGYVDEEKKSIYFIGGRNTFKDPHGLNIISSLRLSDKIFTRVTNCFNDKFCLNQGNNSIGFRIYKPTNDEPAEYSFILHVCDPLSKRPCITHVVENKAFSSTKSGIIEFYTNSKELGLSSKKWYLIDVYIIHKKVKKPMKIHRFYFHS